MKRERLEEEPDPTRDHCGDTTDHTCCSQPTGAIASNAFGDADDCEDIAAGDKRE